MKTYAQVSALTALGDTAKTLIGNIQLSQKARLIIGFWSQINGGAGNTTLENRSGVLEIESGDLSIAPQQYPCEVTTVLTSGTTTYSPRIIPVNIPCRGGEVLSGYITEDLAQTVANTGRWGVLFQGEE